MACLCVCGCILYYSIICYTTTSSGPLLLLQCSRNYIVYVYYTMCVCIEYIFYNDVHRSLELFSHRIQCIWCECLHCIKATSN